MVDLRGRPGVDVEEAEFTAFVRETEPRLRAALVASLGPERGREATAEALAWAWEHRGDLPDLRHPVPYLFRVGQSMTRSRKRPHPAAPAPSAEPPWVEPALPGALAALTRRQRMAVVLVHGYGWTHPEAAEVMGIRSGTVKTHLERGLSRLRSALEVEDV